MKPQPRTRTQTAKAVAASSTSPPTSNKPKPQRLILKVKNAIATPTQLLTPPITPATEATPSRRPKSMGDMANMATDPPKWMLKMQQVQNVTLPGLSYSTPIIQKKTYTEPILKLPESVRHKIYNFAFGDENQITLSTFGDYRQWAAPALLRISAHFLEDALPDFLHRVTFVAHRGEEFRVAKILSVDAVRAAVTKLDFPRSFLNSPADLRTLEIMQACSSLTEVTLDICVDHLLKPKLNEKGEQVSWEPTPSLDVEERYSFDVIARLRSLTVLNYRLVGDCYGWKRQFAGPVLEEIANRLKSAPGQITFKSLGWVGWSEVGAGSRIPTVRGDGLVIVKYELDAMDCSA